LIIGASEGTNESCSDSSGLDGLEMGSVAVGLSHKGDGINQRKSKGWCHSEGPSRSLNASPISEPAPPKKHTHTHTHTHARGQRQRASPECPPPS
jgi:hypothetical protein